MAYVTIDYWDYRPMVWVIEPPYVEARLVVDWTPGYEIYTDSLAWSHDGTRIAFAHDAPGNQSSVSVVDVRTSERSQSDLSLSRGNSNGPTGGAYLVVYPEAWSPGDEYFVVTNIYEYQPGPYSERIGNYLVSEYDLHASALDPASQFLSWVAHGDPLQYAYLQHPYFPDLRDESICLGRPGEQESLACVGGFGEFDLDVIGHLSLAGRMAWRSQETPLDTAMRHGPGEYDYEYAVLALDFQHESWDTLSRGIPGPIVSLSPNGRWLLFIDGMDLSLWDITSNSLRYRSILPEDVFSYQWSNDSEWIVYQLGYSLLAVRVDDPTHPVLLIDPRDAGVSDLAEMQVWLPPAPP